MGKMILIVEDDQMILKLLRDILHVYGYETVEATDGKQGVAIAREKKPDLILMDIQMPVMDGLETTRILKADVETKEIPIIALTGYAMKEDEDKIRDAGCEGYMTKPIELKAFRAKVAEYLST